MTEATIEASIFPTEDPEIVRGAVLNLFPKASVTMELGPDGRGTVVGKTANLEALELRIAEQKIRDTARNILARSISGETITFHLNKQAAAAGKVNFTDGKSTLGDILVKVRCQFPDVLVARITRKGMEESE